MRTAAVAKIFVVLALASACAPSHGDEGPSPVASTSVEAPTISREPVAPEMVAVEPSAPAPKPPATAPKLPPKHCGTGPARGEAWAALAAALALHDVPGDFGCPKTYALVRSPTPCGFDCSAAARANSPELFTFSGRDEATGDAIFVELAHHRKPMVEDGGRCHLTEPFREVLLAGRGVARGRWAEQRFSARSVAAVRPLSRWLDDHDDVTALDIVSFPATDFSSLEEGQYPDSPAKVFHQHSDDVTRLCASVDHVKCWTRRGVARSRMIERRDDGVVVELQLATGEDEGWELESTKKHFDESWPGTIADWTPRFSYGKAPPTWVVEVEPPADVLTLVALVPRLETVEPGVVAVGRYEHVGCPIMTEEEILEWLLSRHDGRWVETPTIDLLEEGIRDLGGSNSIVEAWRGYDADGGHYDKLRLLVFGKDGEFVGPLPITFGEDTAGFGGEYEWRHSVARLSPDCIEVGSGVFEGETFREDEDARPIDRRIRAYFAKHNGRWRISKRGLVRGCPS